jgi:hypothetical protein
MLVPSDESNIDNERLVSAHLTDGDSLAFSVAALFARNGFNLNSCAGDS